MNLSSGDLKDIASLFSRLDQDKDGFLSLEETARAMQLLGNNVTVNDVTLLAGGLRQVSSAQLLDLIKKRMAQGATDETYDSLVQAFMLFDNTASGYIHNSEFRKVMASFGEQFDDNEIDDMLREADTEGTGYVDYATFAHVLYQGTHTSA